MGIHITQCTVIIVLLLLIVQAPLAVEDWVMALIRLYLSIYPDGLWCSIQSSGMLKWRGWEYSFAWCTIMGDMKYCSLDQLKTNNVHKNFTQYPVCPFHIRPPGKNVSTDNLTQTSIRIKPNTIIYPHMCRPW